MVGCSILGCRSRSERKYEGITFHTFPNLPGVKQKWIDATGRVNWKPTKYSKLCSIHFDDECIFIKNNLSRMKAYSIPTFNVHTAGTEMVSCAVPDCTSSRNNNPNNYSFHQFPQNAEIKLKWLKKINRKDWEPRKYSTICSKHFDKNCFSDKNQHRNKLFNDSIPTLFMPKSQETSASSNVPSNSSEKESNAEPPQNEKKKSLKALRNRLLKKNKKLKSIRSKTKQWVGDVEV